VVAVSQQQLVARTAQPVFALGLIRCPGLTCLLRTQVQVSSGGGNPPELDTDSWEAERPITLPHAPLLLMRPPVFPNTGRDEIANNKTNYQSQSLKRHTTKYYVSIFRTRNPR
jgi:hypothetical protein